MAGKVAKAAGGLVKHAFTKDAAAGRAIGNLYTGKKLNGLVLGGALAAGTLMAAGGPSSFGSQNLNPQGAKDVQNIFGSGMKNTMATRHSPMSEPGVNPSILAGARDTSNSSQAPTLGASGDMVFGMHNGRKG